MSETYLKHIRLRRVILSCAVGALTAMSLCSCVDIDADPPSSEVVARYVASEVRGDRYELVDCRKTGERPKEYTYEYRSTDRDLTFTARSYLAPIHFDASVIGYDPSVDTDYADSVHALYDNDMMRIIDESGMGVSVEASSYDVSTADGNDNEEDGNSDDTDDVSNNATVHDEEHWHTDGDAERGTDDASDAASTQLNPAYETDTSMIVVTSYEELPDAVDVLLDMDETYRTELSHNSQKWCDEHPYARVSIRFVPEDEFTPSMSKSDVYSFGATFDSVDVDCSIDGDETLSDLRESFAQHVADGMIDAPMPDGYDDVVHPRMLDVYVDGKPLEYRNEYGTDGILTGDEKEPEYSLMYGREGAFWSDERGEYVMTLDVGNRQSYNEDLYPKNFNGDGTPLEAFVTRNTVELCVIPMLAEPNTVIAQADASECTIHWTACDGMNRKLISTLNADGTGIASVEYTDGDVDTRRLEISDNEYSDYRVNVSVSDFADMFGLTYDIDENDRTIEFESPNGWSVHDN